MHKGFTLLEVLIAIVVLSIGVMSIVWAFSAGMYASTDISNTDTALNIAQAKMEEVKNIPFGDLVNSITNNYYFSGFTTTVDVAEEATGIKQVNVIVSWPAKGGDVAITLATLVTEVN